MMNADTTDLEVLNDIVNNEISEQARVAAKPPIDHLKDAISHDASGNPVLLAGVGDKIVIERVASVLPHRPWLDTKTYRIQVINPATGDLVLLNADEAFAQTSTSNYITGPKRGYRFKLPNAKGVSIGKRKRGRPRKNPDVAPVVAAPVQLDVNGEPVKKKRGRPAGSKNRDKTVIKAEKKAKVQKRKVRKEIAKAAKIAKKKKSK